MKISQICRIPKVNWRPLNHLSCEYFDHGLRIWPLEYICPRSWPQDITLALHCWPGFNLHSSTSSLPHIIQGWTLMVTCMKSTHGNVRVKQCCSAIIVQVKLPRGETDTRVYYSYRRLLTDTRVYYSYRRLLTDTRVYYRYRRLLTDTRVYYSYRRLLTDTRVYYRYRRLLTDTRVYYRYRRLLTDTRVYYSYRRLLTMFELVGSSGRCAMMTDDSSCWECSDHPEVFSSYLVLTRHRVTWPTEGTRRPPTYYPAKAGPGGGTGGTYPPISFQSCFSVSLFSCARPPLVKS